MALHPKMMGKPPRAKVKRKGPPRRKFAGVMPSRLTADSDQLKLPGHDFFKPTKAFIAWFKEQPDLRYANVIEIGAGRGLLAKTLTSAGYKVLAVDKMPRENSLFPVVQLDAVTMDYSVGRLSPSHAVVAARPCHSGFVAEAFTRAANYGVRSILYIGLLKNLDFDLEGLEYHRVFNDAGEDGEAAYRIVGFLGMDRDEYRLVKLDNWNEWSWRRFTAPDKYVNAAGGYFNCSGEGIEERDRVHASGFEYLDQSETGLVTKIVTRFDKKAEKPVTGWLMPDGRLYCCDYRDHDHVAESYFRIGVVKLEKIAVRVSLIDRMGATGLRLYFQTIEVENVTPEQASYLRAAGGKCRSKLWEFPDDL